MPANSCPIISRVHLQIHMKTEGGSVEQNPAIRWWTIIIFGCGTRPFNGTKIFFLSILLEGLIGPRVDETFCLRADDLDNGHIAVRVSVDSTLRDLFFCVCLGDYANTRITMLLLRRAGQKGNAGRISLKVVADQN